MGAATLSLSNEVDAPTSKKSLKGGARDKIQVE
jgi:hypothetical protein